MLFEILTNGCHFSKNHLKSTQKCLDFEWNFEWSSFRMVGTIAIAKACLFEKWTIWNLTIKKSGFQMFQDFKWLDFRSKLNWKNKWSDYQMVGTIAIAQPLDHKKSYLQKVWITNVSRFWMVRFQIPTVFECPVFGSPLYRLPCS